MINNCCNKVKTALNKSIRGARLRFGFTLIEILVAVVIVGILGAIALPQYQRAVLKSRFAALMPIAKSLANSNEAYYLEHGEYAGNAEDLPVQGRRNYSDGTEIEFGTTTDYAYVLATNPSVEHNTYIVYQKHSKNFADNTHCEAFTTDEKANQVCQSFGGTPLEGSLGGADYTAYLLSGNGNGTFEKECTEPLVTERECSSGCGVMTRDSATCNTATGHWDPDDGFDEEDCPKPLGTDTEDCPAGYLGQRSREGNVCKDDNSGYEYGAWTQCEVDKCYNATSCNNGVPTACKSGYYLNNGECKSCGEGVSSCNSSGQATSCQKGYFYKNSSCVKCLAHAVSCTDYYENVVCEDGYYLSGPPPMCMKCREGTLTCHDGNGHAIQCASGYAIDNNRWFCSSCSVYGEGTLSCDHTYGYGSQGAKACATGYCIKGRGSGSYAVAYCVPC